MYPILIGSRALNYWKPERKIHPDTDWDVISFKQHKGCEVHDPLFLNNQDMAGYATWHEVTLPDGCTAKVMSLLGLAILKRSHLWRDLSFQKHITDFHKHGLKEALDRFADKPDNIVNKDLAKRAELTKQAFPQGSQNFMQSKENFFGDAVSRKYDHDYLHELFAYQDKPLYTKLLRQANLAWCEKEKWETLTTEEKLQCVAEEVQVIAAERFMIPNDWKYPCKLAYVKALDKVCTTLCSAWFRDHALDNYPQLVGLFDKSRFDRVQSVLS